MNVANSKTDLKFGDGRNDLIHGFVPTMGALHDGHKELIRTARANCEFLTVSIFVNPTQFGPGGDFLEYPRTIEQDMTALQELRVDQLYVPTTDEIYPQGTLVNITLDPIEYVLEGAQRPGHFSGVANVVLRLFNIVRPTRAYFGDKDAQQLIVIRKLVTDLHLPVEIINCPTVRDTDGMALSSRNIFLDPRERVQAKSISRGLFAAQDAFSTGELSSHALRNIVRKELEPNNLLFIEYVSLCHPESMDEVLGECETGDILSVAVRLNSTRLIDNIRLRNRPESN
jgi:pantoate--beta-alanine ligase